MNKYFSLFVLLYSMTTNAGWSHHFEPHLGDARVWFDLLEGFEEVEPIRDGDSWKFERRFGSEDGALKIHCQQWRTARNKDFISSCQIYLAERTSSVKYDHAIFVRLEDSQQGVQWLQNLMGDEWKSFEKIQLNKKPKPPYWVHRSLISCSAVDLTCRFQFNFVDFE